MKASNEAVAAAADDVRQRDAERAGAKGLARPKVDLDLEYVYMNQEIRIGVDPIPWTLKVQNNKFWKGEAKVTMPLYTGGRIDAANRAAEARHTDASVQGRITEEQLITELAQRYFGLCLARRARDVQSFKADAMKQHSFRAQRLMEEGLIARVEYLNAKVAVANAQVELDAAERDVAIVSEGLSNILVAVGPVEPGSTLFMVADVPSRETFQDYVNEEHPILESVAAKLDLAEQGVRAEEGAERPTVYAFGMHELVTGDLTMLDPKWALGVGFQYPLFDGRQGRHKVEAARAVRDKVGHLQQKARRDLRSLVLKRYEELQKARSQYEAFETTLDLARENLRVRNRAFEEGLATSVEVVDAALSLARAQLGRLKAAFDFDLALFQLLEASGRTQEYNQYLARAIPVPEEPLQRDGAGGGNGAAAAGGDSVKQPATEQSKP